MVNNIVEVNANNLDKYDFFCKKSTKNKPGYQNKEKWIRERFKEGLKIHLLWVDATKSGPTSRGFIEYIPGEYSWRGINADDYMVIHCIWVVGKYKGMGVGTDLLNKCIEDAKKMKKAGVAVVVTSKTWLPKKTLFIKHGFETVDEFPPYLSLLVKKFDKKTPDPTFILKPDSDLLMNLKSAGLDKPIKDGLTVYYTSQCPYIYNAVNTMEEISKEIDVPFQAIALNERKHVLACPHPFGTCAIFFKGKFLTYVYDSKKRFLKLLQSVE
ncbi:MAG: GNAT family N-acetyltransferase [archaeon]|nr:GNAT family N-acetyltransferase [archaeon]